MKKYYLGIFAIVLMGCASLSAITGKSLEEQVVSGANAVSVAANVGTQLLNAKKITVDQARGYNTILRSAGDHLNTAGKSLIECRKSTGSKHDTQPDPCAPTVLGDIQLAVSIVGEVKRALDSK